MRSIAGSVPDPFPATKLPYLQDPPELKYSINSGVILDRARWESRRGRDEARSKRALDFRRQPVGLSPRSLTVDFCSRSQFHISPSPADRPFPGRRPSLSSPRSAIRSDSSLVLSRGGRSRIQFGNFWSCSFPLVRFLASWSQCSAFLADRGFQTCEL